MSSLRHSLPISIIRTAFIIPLFVMGCLCTVFTQWVTLLFFKDKPDIVQGIINITKNHFVVLLSFITQVVNPSEIEITIDTTTVPDAQQFKVDSSGNLHTMFLPNSVLISNHQIYTDWLYLWFLTYTSKLSDSVFIILKDLSKIPVLGYGMKNYNFMFLSRKWEKDKIVLTNQLLEIDANARGMGPANGVKLVSTTDKTFTKWPQGKNSDKIWPYELILFPEGTVPSDRTTKKSAEYTSSKGLPLLKHVLLPRVRGLFLALKKLQGTVEVVYDITTGYGGLTAGQYGEIEYSLKRFYLRGYGPPKINYFIRGWRLKDIPLGKDVEDVDDIPEEDLKKFEDWLLGVWYDKDKLMQNFYTFGNWGETKYETKSIVGDFKLRNPLEIISPYLVAISAALLLRIAYTLIKRIFV
ncbi:putative acyltransferase CST26 [Candida viswanathii]|uniref:Putative acyltransferase CST26 n=1 Tax=Candida viswanathii TaxID=5486 RepID=A0A367XVX9_9ASCO|nr:putative acyltransferase CST26 [Candida viswanathii]